MIKHSLLSILLVFGFGCIEAQANVGGSRLKSVEDYDSNWVLLVGGRYGATEVRHQETSSVTGYVALGEDVRVPNLGYGIGLMYELLPQQQLSFSVKALGGLSDGSVSNKAGNLSEFKETREGVYFGGGVSVNYNLYLYGYKVQPYVGFDMLIEEGSLKLDHNSFQSLTQYDYTDTLGMASVGVRVFDSEVDLMSFLEFKYPFEISSDIVGNAQDIGTGATAAVTAGEFKRVPFVASIGFGLMF